MKHPLNTILYGPPGTGKTYNTAAYAVAIIEGKAIETVQAEPYSAVHRRFLEYREQGRIDFTTFHQSYGYEDFIEGIRPNVSGDGAMDYQQYTGVFKAFCERAEKACPAADTTDPTSTPPAAPEPAEAAPSSGDSDESVQPRKDFSISFIWFNMAKNEDSHRDCFDNGFAFIGGWSTEQELMDPSATMSDYDQKLTQKFRGLPIGDIICSKLTISGVVDGVGIITSGVYIDRPSSMGGYWCLCRKVRWIHKHVNLWAFQAFDKLTNFPRSTLTTYTPSSKQFHWNKLCEILKLPSAQGEADNAMGETEVANVTASKGTNDPAPCVFIIDEINRGNISKIFGELITLIEPSKRLGASEETKALLPYSGDEFGVPPNVYILGTMNTADRSIALLDTALRRRFDFVEMMPRPELLRDIRVEGSAGEDTGIDLEKMLGTMNDRIEFLLDREHTIGHAYFMGAFPSAPTIAGLAAIFRNRIVPLLQEYFFDDYSKIRLVLGDVAKPAAAQFFTEKGPVGVFSGYADDAVDADRRIYRLNAAAFENPAAYAGIYQANS